MTTPSPTPTPSSSDLNAFAAKYGIDMSSLSANASSSDPKVPSRVTNETFGAGSWSDARDSYENANDSKASNDITTSRTLTDVTKDVLRMSDSDLQALGTRLVDAGLLQPGWTRDDINSAWADLTKKAAAYHDANPSTNLTPDDMIDLYAHSGASAGATTMQKFVTSSYQLSDPDTARTLLGAVLSDALGRKATGKEQDDFQSALNEAQYNNPQITTRTVTGSADPVTGQYKNTQTSQVGGVDPNAFAKQYGENDVDNTAEYQHYQAATTYYNALLQAVRGPFG